MPTATQYLDTLYPKLQARATELKKPEDYYRGDHDLPFLNKAHAQKMRAGFKQMLDESKTNFMRLVVEVTEERLLIEGIRLSATSDLQSDKDSWDIWQGNQLDSLSRDAMQAALIKGVSYVSVWPSEDPDSKYASIAVEDPCEVIVEYTPGSNFRKRDAALKVWRDNVQGIERANVYLPDELHKFWRKVVPTVDTSPGVGALTGGDRALGFEYGVANPAQGPPKNSSWHYMPGIGSGGKEVVPNPLGVVPIIPLRNRGRLLIEGESEIADSIPVQNQINSFLFLLSLAGYFGAHKQRWATGLTLIEDEETGEVKEPFDVAIDKMIVAEDEIVKFGEFQQTDLGGYLQALDQKITHLAITTRTPKHYLLPTGQEPSGDSIKSSESGLVRKCGRKKTSFGESFEEVMRLARTAQGLGETPVDSELVWASSETENMAAKTDSVVKQFEGGLIPKEVALEQLGYSQIQISRIMAAGVADSLIKALNDPGAGAKPPETPTKTASK